MSITSPTSCTITLLLLCLISSESTDAQHPPRIRDSAGIRIVEHGRTTQLSTVLRISPTPLVDFGGLRDDLQAELSARMPYLRARPLSDGRWVVMDRAVLKIFDSTGSFQFSISREGSGPGEFRQLRDACVTPGDTILAISLSDRRLAAFDASGTHLRTVVLDGEVRDNPCLSDGTVLVRRGSRPNPQSRYSASDAALMDRVSEVVRVRWDGRIVGSLGLLQAESLDPTFPELANVSGGSGRTIVGNGISPEYRVYNLSGKLLEVIRWESIPAPVTDAMRAAAVKRRGWNPGPWKRKALPFYAGIIASPDSHVWVQDYWPDGGELPRPMDYTAFSIDGELIGRIEVPRLGNKFGATISWIGRDKILLGWRDQDGSPHLTLHTLLR